MLNFDRNYVRLNEFPEWFTAGENTLYRVRPAAGADPSARSGSPRAASRGERMVLGSELIAGIVLEPGDWMVEPLGKASDSGVAAHAAALEAYDAGERSRR